MHICTHDETYQYQSRPCRLSFGFYLDDLKTVNMIFIVSLNLSSKLSYFFHHFILLTDYNNDTHVI